MADAKITALTAETAPVATDLLVMVDDPAGTPVTEKVTMQDVVQGLGATQAEQETGTAVNRIVTPGRQHFHLSAVKCHGFTTGGATPVLHANSYNTTSITDTAAGRLTVTIGNDFSSANWCGTCTPTCATNANRMTALVTKAAGSVILESSSATTTLADPGTGWDWQFTGDL